ncbi:MAG: hypothetical protein AABX61_03935 [Nanoarchaeota archaeon]
MPFIGFNFDRIFAERNIDEIKENLSVKHNMNIKDLTEEEINLEKKQEVLKFKFEFLLKYDPNVAEIKIDGHLLFLESPKKMKEIVQNWKKDKKLPPEITQSLFNTILTKSNIKALQLSQDLNLPPHIPMPRLTRQQPKKNVNEYIG